MDKIKISVVIIAKNEEKNIARCLKSVEWADESIVVDAFSTDRTADIAKSFGAKVVQHDFSGSFADDRNIGLQIARNDWVLELDADDVVTEDFRLKMREALARKEGVVIYKFKRRNFFLGHSMDHGGFHHYIPNLVNKNFVKYGGDIHEVPVYKGREGVIDAQIEHYPFSSISQFIERQNRYTDIAARDTLKRFGRLKESDISKKMVLKPVKTFWKSFVKKQGYKEGVYGLVFAVLFALIDFLKWAKYWELVKKGNKT